MTMVYAAAEPLKQAAALRNQAIRLLARREQSRCELQQKLHLRMLEKGWFVDLEHLLDELVRQGLQSDVRFAEVLVRSKANNGYGVSRVLKWAHQYGLSKILVQEQIEEQTHDWFENALRQKRKYCGWNIALTPQERAKQVRYLYQRGFSSEQIQYALQTPPD